MVRSRVLLQKFAKIFISTENNSLQSAVYIKEIKILNEN